MEIVPRRRMERPRTRMLTFRVTDVEFEELQAASNLSGARCLSDYLRHAVLRTLDPIDAQLTKKILNVEQRMGLLESRVSDLSDLRSGKD